MTFPLIWIVSAWGFCKITQSMRNPNVSLLLTDTSR